VEYIALSLKISPSEPFSDLITYRLGELDYEMFEEQPDGILAYVRSSQFKEEDIRSILDECHSMNCEVSYSYKHIPWQNWNETWEKNFHPEVISNQVYIRARFHPPAPQYPIELIVEPRMAFGTGHHATTRQMMEQMLLLDFRNKTVLDMGCGTGILALLASKLGGSEITAIDNDPNSVSISIENAAENDASNISVIEGEAASIKGVYDIVLANINRNIILHDLPVYSAAMDHNGQLLTSGYYVDDLDAIKSGCAKNGLNYVHHSEQENWCCALFSKS
jgi:ribosomal protein L11 methyltransferase